MIAVGLSVWGGDDLRTLAVDACAGLVRDAVEALHAWETLPGPDRPPGASTTCWTRCARGLPYTGV